ncbi:MAG: molybdenum cofactor guanylyltransferase MobA [Cycloclasticus sp. symbiont of Poecilosclerida sp. N]|nr:MAG: molybdenum cofactor guanylyltransferase MobA [Cycloclasticus sp. symbiont of Poecilosclerida sp. N]
MPIENNRIVSVILNGGLSRRMDNKNKAFLQLAGKPLIEHVLNKLRPPSETLIINSNDQNKRLEAYGLPIVKDSLDGFLGPLAGILSAMEWVSEYQPQCHLLASIPIDTPFLPDNLINKLHQRLLESQATLAFAASNGRIHPVIGLWPIALMDDLRSAIVNEGILKVDLWTSRYKTTHLSFDYQTVDPFFNINHDDDLLQAKQFLLRGEINNQGNAR